MGKLQDYKMFLEIFRQRDKELTNPVLREMNDHNIRETKKQIRRLENEMPDL